VRDGWCVLRPCFPSVNVFVTANKKHDLYPSVHYTPVMIPSCAHFISDVTIEIRSVLVLISFSSCRNGEVRRKFPELQAAGVAGRTEPPAGPRIRVFRRQNDIHHRRVGIPRKGLDREAPQEMSRHRKNLFATPTQKRKQPQTESGTDIFVRGKCTLLLLLLILFYGMRICAYFTADG